MTSQELITHLKQNPFVCAPMAGITDHAFRSFIRKKGSSIVVTELVSATGIEYKSDRTLKLMSFSDEQRPIGIQLFGEDPEIMSRAAQLVEGMGADFVDVNFGCPVPKVVKKGAGSAMLKDLPAMEKLLTAMVKAVKIPVTIKIRTGWDSNSRNATEVCKLAADTGITWVAIHGRTRAQAYTGFADWDYISEVKAKAPLPVLGNGDITTAKQAVDRLNSSGVDGVLIGRGCLKNPLIFQESMLIWQGQSLEKLERNHVKVFSELFSHITAHCDEHITQLQMKKFAAWFATGYSGAAAFRKDLFQSKSTDEIMNKAFGFFEKINNEHQENNSSNEGFLMGGHG